MGLFLMAAEVLLQRQPKPPARHTNIGPIKQTGSSKLQSASKFLRISKAVVAVHTSVPRYAGGEVL